MTEKWQKRKTATSPRHAPMNCNKAADEDFVVNANVRTAESAQYVICMTFKAKNKHAM